MTINVGAAIVEEKASSTDVISDSSAIVDGAFNAGTITALTQSTDFVPFGEAVLDIQLATAPSAGAFVALYRRALNIKSTNDAEVPDSDFLHKRVGTFPVNLITTRQYIDLQNIPLILDQEFYIRNQAGQSTTGTTVVTITPQSYNTK